MTDLPEKLRDREARKTAKRDEKKKLIAMSAIAALRELGYANTSLRDIAAKSDLSLGMLHYYFEDRSDLIIYCVQHYKIRFVDRIETAISDAPDRDTMVERFAEALTFSIHDPDTTHPLWYDIRSQAMFDARFKPVVDEIESSLISLVAQALEIAGRPEADPELSYMQLDGVFRFLMQVQIGPSPRPREEVRERFRAVLSEFL